jgi:hypothetical protein
MEKVDRAIAEFFRTLVAVPVSYVLHLLDNIMIFFVVLATAAISIIYAVFPFKLLKRAQDDLIHFLANQ